MRVSKELKSDKIEEFDLAIHYIFMQNFISQ